MRESEITPGDVATLYGTKDLVELVAVLNLMAPGVSGWLLLHAAGGRQAAMMMGHSQEPLDPLAASQISKIRYPCTSEPVAPDVPWAKDLLGLLHYQFNVEETSILAPIWMSGSLLAVAGVIGTNLSAEALARGVVLGVRRLHEIDTLQRDVEGHRYLLNRSTKTILLAMETGRILAGTEGGLAILRGLQVSETTDILPITYRRAIESGDKEVIQGDLRASISYPPLLPAYTTAEPLVAIRFSSGLTTSTGDRLKTLTPAERLVYERLLTGDRNKEIAERLGRSRHTIRHHVSAVLAKTGFSDRFLLLAAAKQPEIKETGKLFNSQVPPLPVVDSLLPAKKLVVGKRKMPEEA